MCARAGHLGPGWTSGTWPPRPRGGGGGRGRRRGRGGRRGGGAGGCGEVISALGRQRSESPAGRNESDRSTRGGRRWRGRLRAQGKRRARGRGLGRPPGRAPWDPPGARERRGGRAPREGRAARGRAAGAPGSHLRAPRPGPAPGAAGQPGLCDPGPGLGRGRDLCAPRPEPECRPVWERPPGLGSQPGPSAARPGWASPLQAEAASASSQNGADVALRVSPASSIRTGLPHFLPERGAVLRAPAVRGGRRSQPGPAEQGSRVFAPAGAGGRGEGGSRGSPESPWAPRAPVARAPFLPQAGPETPPEVGLVLIGSRSVGPSSLEEQAPPPVYRTEFCLAWLRGRV